MSLSETDLKAFREFEKAGWEKAAAAYDRHWGPLSQQSADAILTSAGVGAGSRVLDVATGAGYLAASAAERGANVVAIDFARSQVELARQRYPAIEFTEASAEDLPFTESSFDAVVMGFGANHLPNPEAAFREVYRVLKRGGCFALTVWAAPERNAGFRMVLRAIEEN
jgi:ubiquinone/menaquinone biosynthesis C-methylase UbiE